MNSIVKGYKIVILFGLITLLFDFQTRMRFKTVRINSINTVKPNISDQLNSKNKYLLNASCDRSISCKGMFFNYNLMAVNIKSIIFFKRLLYCKAIDKV